MNFSLRECGSRPISCAAWKQPLQEREWDVPAALREETITVFFSCWVPENNCKRQRLLNSSESQTFVSLGGSPLRQRSFLLLRLHGLKSDTQLAVTHTLENPTLVVYLWLECYCSSGPDMQHNTALEQGGPWGGGGGGMFIKMHITNPFWKSNLTPCFNWGMQKEICSIQGHPITALRPFLWFVYPTHFSRVYRHSKV